MEIVHLSKENIIQIHQNGLDLFDGSPGIAEDGKKLDSIYRMPEAGFGDHDEYPTIHEKAAVYHYYLASGHAFIDGNKRVAVSAAWLFLAINGYTLLTTDDEIYEFTMMVANHETRPPFEVAKQWFEERVVKE